uniref:Uncharacterized protein n=1 Tax=Caenorhabditis japonica TaxID=281687 RepID=A0A8R1DN10_CAEJA
MGLLVILTMLTLFAVGEMLPVVPWAVRNETDMVDSSTEQTFQELNVVISNRGYAYMTALVVMMLFGAFVYCHTASIRKQRILEQLNERDLLPEWSPLLITSKNIRPPTPYEQVV